MKKNYHEYQVSRGFNVVNGVFMVCFLVIGIFAAWSVIGHTVEGLVMFTITLVLLIAWFAQPRHTGLYLLFLVIVSFGIKYYTIVHLLPPPIQDFKTIYDAAERLLWGDRSFNQLKYFYDWAYQTPFVLYDYFILKVKNDIQFIKLVNVLVSVGINVLIYLTLKGSVKERYAKAVATVFAFMPFPIVMNTWLSNQPAATFLTYLGLYFFVKKSRLIPFVLPRLMIAGLLVGLGNLMRPEGLVVLVAAGTWLLFEWLSDFGISGATRFITKAAAFMVPYVLICALASTVVVTSGINPHGIKNNNPYWKFTLGLNHEAKGMWNQEDYQWLQEQEATKETSVKDIQMPVIQERAFEQSDLLPELFANKMYIFWAFPRLYPAFEYLKEGEKELEAELKLLPEESGKEELEKLREYQKSREYYLLYLNKTDVWLFVIMMGLAAAGCFEIGRRQIREKRFDPEGHYLFAFFIFATALIYLLIEVQPRYVYFVQPAVLILAAYGLQLFGGRDKG